MAARNGASPCRYQTKAGPAIILVTEIITTMTILIIIINNLGYYSTMTHMHGDR